MSRSALLLLFLTACAAPQQRREFRDGAPVRAAPVEPRTVYTPTGAGLPEYWAEPDAPKPERSPHKRVLPQTPETMKGPGIWAANEPEPEYRLTLLKIFMLLPPDPTEFEEETADNCAVAMEQVGGQEWPHLLRMAGPDRACAAARLYAHCAQGLLREAEFRRASGEEYEEEAMAAFRRLVAASKRMEELACKTQLPEDVERSLTAIAQRWTKIHERVSQ